MSAKITYKTTDGKGKRAISGKSTEQEPTDNDQLLEESDKVPPSPISEEQKIAGSPHDIPGRSPMIVVRLKKGTQQAFAYAYLLEVGFTGANGEDTINLDFGFCQVVLSGLNLAETFQEIATHKSAIIHEHSPETIESRGTGVKSISIIRPEKNE